MAILGRVRELSLQFAERKLAPVQPAVDRRVDVTADNTAQSDEDHAIECNLAVE